MGRRGESTPLEMEPAAKELMASKVQANGVGGWRSGKKILTDPGRTALYWRDDPVINKKGGGWVKPRPNYSLKHSHN